jgi:CRP/FNR family transcriptional regulator, polysaccharide utilization system transcription regulator
MPELYNYCDQDCVSCNFRSEMFNFLSRDELELVNRNKSTIRFRKGETIRKQGTVMTHVISVNSGLAKIFLEVPNRHQTILRIVKPTHFIGGPGIYLDQIHHYSVSAMVDTTVCFIDMKVFKSILHRNDRFSEEFMKDFSRNTLSVYERLVNHTYKEIPGRMAETLLYLSDSVYESTRFNSHLSKQELADISGMSYDSCVKILREFQHDGIIMLKNNELEILNLEGLRNISKLG